MDARILLLEPSSLRYRLRDRPRTRSACRADPWQFRRLAHIPQSGDRSPVCPQGVHRPHRETQAPNAKSRWCLGALDSVRQQNGMQKHATLGFVLQWTENVDVLAVEVQRTGVLNAQRNRLRRHALHGAGNTPCALFALDRKMQRLKVNTRIFRTASYPITDLQRIAAMLSVPASSDYPGNSALPDHNADLSG